MDYIQGSEYKNQTLFFKNDFGLSTKTYTDVSRMSLEICRAAEEAVGPNVVEGAQLVRNLWRLYTHNDEGRVKLLSTGFMVRGIRIQPLDRNPYLAQRRDEDAVRVTIRRLPLSVDNETIKTFLLEKKVELVGDIKYEYHRDPDTKMLTRFKTGDRFVWTKPLLEALPRDTSIAHFKCKIYHRDQFQAICKICDDTGHREGDSKCKFFMEVPNLTTIKGYSNPLSNQHPTPVTVDAKTFPSVEHAFQFQRAMAAEREDIAEDILQAKHAGVAKAIGRTLPDEEPDFSVGILEELMLEKFNASSTFKEALRETGTAFIAHTVADPFWGTGLNEEVTGKVNPKFWPGKNKIGELLMKIRDEHLLSSKDNRERAMVQSTIDFYPRRESSESRKRTLMSPPDEPSPKNRSGKVKNNKKS